MPSIVGMDAMLCIMPSILMIGNTSGRPAESSRQSGSQWRGRSCTHRALAGHQILLRTPIMGLMGSRH
jgi:hypothetical protein